MKTVCLRGWGMAKAWIVVSLLSLMTLHGNKSTRECEKPCVVSVVLSSSVYQTEFPLVFTVIVVNQLRRRRLFLRLAALISRFTIMAAVEEPPLHCP